MTKKIKIVWVNTYEHYESDYEGDRYSYNVARVSDNFLIDWEEVSDEDYQELVDRWNIIEREFIKKKEYRNKHLLLLVSDESNPVTAFDCLKSLEEYWKRLEKEEKDRHAAEEKKKADAKAKRDAKKKEKERQEFERLQKIFNSEKV